MWVPYSASVKENEMKNLYVKPLPGKWIKVSFCWKYMYIPFAAATLLFARAFEDERKFFFRLLVKVMRFQSQFSSWRPFSCSKNEVDCETSVS
jgi:hypothetical protein